MRLSIAVLAALALVALLPAAAAHGGLTLNEFDIYAISDFEGQEDSFPWEGFEIWDIYAGDGYHEALGSHGVYFKANLAGDGTARPSGSQSWDVRFTYTVGDDEYTRNISHDGSDVTTDFEALEWQIADGNVFQIYAWAPVPEWEGLSITDLVVLSSVDGEPRDIAPGGIYDPATGQEVPVNAPPTPVFPEIGEGRIVETVPLTGPAKFLDIAIDRQPDNAYLFTVTNPLAQQGQHFMFRANATPGWTVTGTPNAESLEGGSMAEFVLQFDPADEGIIAPYPFDLMTDIGGLQTYYAYVGAGGDVLVTNDASAAATFTVDAPDVEAPGVGLVAVGMVALALAARKRSGRA